MIPRMPALQMADIDARRICLIKPSALGDVAQTLPLLDVLRAKFPTAEISWVIRSDLADLLQGHPALSETILYHRAGGWREWSRLLATLRQRRFDLVLDLQGLLRTGLMTFATRAKWRIGLETAREGSSLACNYRLPDSGRNVPAHVRYWRVAEALGLAEYPIRAGIYTTAEDESWVAGKIAHFPRPWLAIHAGAGWETKRWPVEKFAEIARRFPGSIVAVGSRSEHPFAAQIVEAASATGRYALNLAGATTLKQLAAVLRAADFMLSNDSGPLHVAAAVGTPVVGVFTCTSPLLSGPAPVGSDGVRHEFVSTDVACRASYRKTCPFTGEAHQSCLAELSVERVWHAVEQVLERQIAVRLPA